VITGILAPVDGCERSEAVLPYVEELSNRLNANVTLLHVFPPSLHLQRDAHIHYIETLATHLRDRLRHAGLEAIGVALEGTPNREIADFAARDDIGLIAASPHSQSSDGHWSRLDAPRTKSFERRASLCCLSVRETRRRTPAPNS